MNKAFIDYIYMSILLNNYITEFKALAVLEYHTALCNASYIQDNHISSLLVEIVHLSDEKYNQKQEIKSPLNRSSSVRPTCWLLVDSIGTNCSIYAYSMWQMAHFYIQSIHISENVKLILWSNILPNLHTPWYRAASDTSCKFYHADNSSR